MTVLTGENWLVRYDDEGNLCVPPSSDTSIEGFVSFGYSVRELGEEVFFCLRISKWCISELSDLHTWKNSRVWSSLAIAIWMSGCRRA